MCFNFMHFPFKLQLHMDLHVCFVKYYFARSMQKFYTFTGCMTRNIHLLSYAQLPPYRANDGVTEEGAPIAGNLITSKDASNVPSSREFRICPTMCMGN